MNEYLSCPICKGSTALIDVVDFNKSCEERRGKFLALTGRPIYYSRCFVCGFVFAPKMHQWSTQEFAEYVYNDSYVDVDPDYLKERPTADATSLR